MNKIVAGIAAVAAAASVATLAVVSTEDTTPEVTVQAAVPLPTAVPLVEVMNASYRCRGPINIDVLRVTITDNAFRDAVQAAPGCTGRVGSLQITSNGADGLKISNASATNPVHDLTVEGGFIHFTGIAPGAHQDGVQAMGGRDVNLNGLVIDSYGFSSVYFSLGGGLIAQPATQPQRVICNGCTLKGGGAPMSVGWSTDSGVRNSVVCMLTPRITARATNPVNENNTFIPKSDPRCKF